MTLKPQNHSLHGQYQWLSSSRTASSQYLLVRSLGYHLYSIWLFLVSDLKTIVLPMMLFGTINALSTRALDMGDTGIRFPSEILYRIPKTVFWIISNLLPFLIDNQRHPKSILEDSINKPYRPLPSKRLHPELARVWMMFLYPIAVLVSLMLGGLRQCVLLVFLGIWYNDFGGADVHCASRNLINAAGFVSYASGAMEIALGTHLKLEGRLLQWLTIIAVAVFTSVHSQDLPDQEGDLLCGRNSVPLALGDGFARWTVATSVLLFSVACPSFWSSPGWVFASLISLGTIVSGRTLMTRTVGDDKFTFRLWNLWMVGIYGLPLIKSLELSSGN